MEQRVFFEKFATGDETISYGVSLAIPHVFVICMLKIGTKRRDKIYMIWVLLMRSVSDAIVVPEWRSVCLVCGSLLKRVSFLSWECVRLGGEVRLWSVSSWLISIINLMEL